MSIPALTPDHIAQVLGDDPVWPDHEAQPFLHLAFGRRIAAELTETFGEDFMMDVTLLAGQIEDPDYERWEDLNTAFNTKHCKADDRGASVLAACVKAELAAM